MKTLGVSVHPEVFKKADLVKVLPVVTVKEVAKSTHIDFEKDSYSEIRDVVTMDVDTHIMSIEKEKSDGESEAYEAKPIRRSTLQLKRRSEHGYEGGYNNYPQQVQTPQRQLQGRSKFVNVCSSQSCAPQPQPVYSEPR